VTIFNTDRFSAHNLLTSEHSTSFKFQDKWEACINKYCNEIRRRASVVYICYMHSQMTWKKINM